MAWAVALLGLEASVKAEPVIRWIYPSAPSQDPQPWEYLSFYQWGSAVIVQGGDLLPQDGVPDGLLPIKTRVYDIGSPAFVVTRTWAPYTIPPNAMPLFSEESAKGWDSSLGDGWLNTDHFRDPFLPSGQSFGITSLGWVNVRHYPWTWWHDKQEWRYVVNGGIADEHNAFWFYSPSAGWLWTTRGLFPWVLSLRDGWSWQPGVPTNASRP